MISSKSREKKQRRRPAKTMRLAQSAESLNAERDRRPSRLKAATIGLIEQTDVNRKRAFELRLPPHRLSYPAIARVLGVSVSTAHSYVKEEHGALLDEIVEKKEHLRHIENETIDALMERFLPIALNPQRMGVDLSLKATDRIIRLIEQKCRLNGLDAAPNVKTESEQRYDAQWRRDLYEAMARRTAKSSAKPGAEEPLQKPKRLTHPAVPRLTWKIRLKPKAFPPLPHSTQPSLPPPRPDIVITSQ